MFTIRPLVTRISSFFARFSGLFKRMLWLVPFLFFLVGYYITERMVGTRTLQAPHLIGKGLHDAVRILAPYRLNLRILDEVEEPAMAEGTIIDQRPAPGANIKIYQPLGIVISRQPKPLAAPDFVNMGLPDIQKLAEKTGVRLLAHPCKSDLPAQQCLAQAPAAGTVLTDKTVNVYIASPNASLYLLPNFVGQSLDRTCAFLRAHQIAFEIMPHEYAPYTYWSACTVTAQKPLAGSFVSLANLPTVQLSVERRSAE